MKKKHFAISVLIVLVIAAVMLFKANGKHAKIDEWSSNLAAEQIELAAVSVGYGVDQLGYTIPVSEYKELITLLGTVTEDTCSRKRPTDIEKTDYNLALRYDGKLWLFQCYDNGIISLTFEDKSTAVYYGCEKSLLYIDCPELWKYITNTVDSKATK